jgi:hypothetical protein
MKAICKIEGHICRRDGRRQLQSLGMSVVGRLIADAVIAPTKYEALKKDVRVTRSFGWPSSPIKEEPEIIQKTIPNPSSIRANIYIPTSRRSALKTELLSGMDHLPFCANP